MILCWPLINGLPSDKGSKATEADIEIILANYDRDASLLCNENSIANWNVQTDTNNAELKEIQVNIITNCLLLLCQQQVVLFVIIPNIDSFV